MNATSTQQLVVQFSDAIAQITDAAVTGAGNGWELMLQKQTVDAFLHGGILLLLLAVIVGCVYWMYWAVRYDDEVGQGLAFLVGIIPAIMSMISFFPVVGNFIYEVFLPEYAAIQEIINLIN